MNKSCRMIYTFLLKSKKYVNINQHLSLKEKSQTYILWVHLLYSSYRYPLDSMVGSGRYSTGTFNAPNLSRGQLFTLLCQPADVVNVANTWVSYMTDWARSRDHKLCINSFVALLNPRRQEQYSSIQSSY